MKVLGEYSEKGDGKKNQDCYGYLEDFFWVIDGATDLFNVNQFDDDDDVNWYVNRLNARIKSHVSTNLSPKEVLSAAIKSLYRDIRRENVRIDEIETYKLPTYAISIGKIRGNTLNYVILGDCFCGVLQNNMDVILLTDNRIKEFSSRNKTRIKKLRSEKRLTAKNELAIFQETRKQANTLSGYWIGDIREDCLKHSIEGELKVSAGTKLLLFTDGFYEALDTFHILNMDAHLFNNNILADTMKRLRTLQNKDHERKNIRARKKDDATYLLLESE